MTAGDIMTRNQFIGLARKIVQSINDASLEGTYRVLELLTSKYEFMRDIGLAYFCIEPQYLDEITGYKTEGD